MTDHPFPVTDDASLLADVRRAIPPGLTRIAVAVSGGGDSLALLHLLSRLCPDAGPALQAVTLDHRLRPDSGKEAAFVADVCQRLGVPHAVVAWQHDRLCGNRMAAARSARRELLSAWAQDSAVQALMLAHTADDQAEGLLMALGRESGLDGLSGMPTAATVGGVLWLRPLLGHSRAALRAYLVRHGEAWIDDPTNADPRYLRTRARQAVTGLQGMGLSAEAMAFSVALLAQARAALVQLAADFARDKVEEIAGSLELDRADLCALPPDLQRRVIAGAIRWIGGAPHPPRRRTLAAVLDALNAGRSVTAGGVRFRCGGRRLRVVREPRALMGPARPGTLWDGRWQVEGPPGEIRALGPEGLVQVPGWRACGVSRDALVVSPAIWDGPRLIAAPLAGFGPSSRAWIAPGFASFLLSH